MVPCEELSMLAHLWSRFDAVNVLTICAACCWATVALCATAAPQGSAESRLREVGIEPTEEGVKKYLESLLDGRLDGEAEALIAQLGADEFEVREAASRKLLSGRLSSLA